LNEIKVTTYPQLFPKIWFDKEGEKQLLIFEANEYPVKPVAYKNRHYKRVHNSNHLLTLEENGDFFKVELRIAEQVTTQVTNLLKVLDMPLSRQELQEKLGLRNKEHFRQSYLRPALEEGLIAMSNPAKPRAADQKYCITERGLACLYDMAKE
jgi:predicted HTH transcriptional regulator